MGAAAMIAGATGGWAAILALMIGGGLGSFITSLLNGNSWRRIGIDTFIGCFLNFTAGGLGQLGGHAFSAFEAFFIELDIYLIYGISLQHVDADQPQERSHEEGLVAFRRRNLRFRSYGFDPDCLSA